MQDMGSDCGNVKELARPTGASLFLALFYNLIGRFALDRSRQSALSHSRLWAAIDALARRNGLSPSSLARKAGLDATTFNRSKRVGLDGRPRWPSMESIAKTLDATGSSLDDLFALLSAPDVADPLPPVRSVPFTGTSKAVQPGFFDAGGRPVGPGWDRVEFPASAHDELFALEIADDAFLPLYRAGIIIVVTPDAEIRRGDRILARHRSEGLIVRTLSRVTTAAMECEPDAPGWSTCLSRRDILWVGRIVWASQ
jgi:phage repressor protein C with HTH and peptisase S24 domain